MPRLKPDQQRQRREHILDAAEQCVAAKGFHATTMQDICRAAGVSPGALYVYFASKEALIAGIAERDRAEFASRLQSVSAAPDFFQALETMATQYFADEPRHKRMMCVEIGVEATRNPRIGEIHQRVDGFVAESFRALFQRLQDEGRIRPERDLDTVVQVFMTIGDGLFWRRAVDPTFDAKQILPEIVSLVRALLRPIEDRDEPAAARPSATKETIR